MCITVSVAKTGTGSTIVASQDQAIRINNFEYRILMERHDSKCRWWK